MKRNGCAANRYASILYRLSQPYFDQQLSAYRIGSGQQFFLLRIYEHPGVGLLELAETGYYDKGTTHRAVRKLEEEGYVRTTGDLADKRVRHLYATDKALPIIEATYQVLEKWRQVLSQDIPPEELTAAEAVMRKMAENAHHYVKEQRKDMYNAERASHSEKSAGL